MYVQGTKSVQEARARSQGVKKGEVGCSASTGHLHESDAEPMFAAEAPKLLLCSLSNFRDRRLGAFQDHQEREEDPCQIFHRHSRLHRPLPVPLAPDLILLLSSLHLLFRPRFSLQLPTSVHLDQAPECLLPRRNLDPSLMLSPLAPLVRLVELSPPIPPF